MITNYSQNYTLASSDPNFPARILLYDKAGELCRIDRHKHRDIEIVYVMRGKLSMNISGEERVIGPNEFCFVNSYDLHSNTYVSDPKAHVKYQVVLLSYSFMRSYMPDFDDYRFNTEAESVHSEITTELRKISELISLNEKFAELHILGTLINLVDILFSKCAVLRSTSELKLREIPVYDYLSMTELYVSEHYKENITLGEIADYIGLSKNYFAKYFKLKRGKTVMQYVNEVRLKNAITDIENTEVNETVAATRNGFTSVKSFINTFKSMYKCTPSEYKKLYGAFPSSYTYVDRRDRNIFM